LIARVFDIVALSASKIALVVVVAHFESVSVGAARSVRLFLAGETRPATRDPGFVDAAAHKAARGAGLLDVAVGWCATAGFRSVVSEKSVFS
jgi:hypothetical protein